MIESQLGLPIDIHGGGHDLIFPHHENEIAQARCANQGGEFSRYWMHNGFLDFSGTKMSKSLGNVALVHDLIETWPGEVLRWALLKGHYRSPLDWTETLLAQSRRELDHLYGALQRATEDVDTGVGQTGETDELALEPLLDDLNTPLAISRLHGLAREFDQPASRSDARRKFAVLAGVLGVLQQAPDAWFEKGADEGLRAAVQALIEARDAARKAKDWSAADRLRDQLDALNVLVMDGPNGATWRMKDN